MRVHITATRIDGPNAGKAYAAQVDIHDGGHVDEMGREAARLLRRALTDPPPTAKMVNPMDAVFRELFRRLYGEGSLPSVEDAIARLARKHGGDAPDVLAARIRAIVGGE